MVPEWLSQIVGLKSGVLSEESVTMMKSTDSKQSNDWVHSHHEYGLGTSS